MKTETDITVDHQEEMRATSGRVDTPWMFMGQTKGDWYMYWSRFPFRHCIIESRTVRFGPLTSSFQFALSRLLPTSSAASMLESIASFYPMKTILTNLMRWGHGPVSLPAWVLLSFSYDFIYQRPGLTGLATVGCILGNWFVSWWFTWFLGRRLSFAFAPLIIIVGVAMQAGAQSFGVIVTGRVIAGIGSVMYVLSFNFHSHF